jgi:hypothetical protein
MQADIITSQSLLILAASRKTMPEIDYAASLVCYVTRMLKLDYMRPRSWGGCGWE